MKIHRAAYIIIFACRCATANVIVDFTGIPDGTPVQVGNPYGGVLTLQAQASVDIRNEDPVTDILLSETTVTVDGTIQRGGALQVFPPTVLAPNGFPEGPAHYHSDITAAFSQPVDGVSFTAYCWAQARYSYTGMDALGNPFSGNGFIPSDNPNGPNGPNPPLITIIPNIPLGGYLTGFDLLNDDSGYAGGAAIWLTEVDFTDLPRVPDHLGAWPLAVALAGLVALRSRPERTPTGG